MTKRLIVTSDGSHTIYIPELDEHYHSVHGAVQESMHIFISAGLKHCFKDNIKILEAGFGTGLNALLTAIEIYETSISVNYTTIEKYPLSDEMIRSLNHRNIAGNLSETFFDKLHNSPWNKPEAISGNFTLFKIKGSLDDSIPDGSFDLIYFDAFGPDKQPGMWTPSIFRRISEVTAAGGIFVTYSAKGEVKRNLRMNGFDVSLLPGPPGKRQMIRAVKK